MQYRCHHLCLSCAKKSFFLDSYHIFMYSLEHHLPYLPHHQLLSFYGVYTYSTVNDISLRLIFTLLNLRRSSSPTVPEFWLPSGAV